MVKHSVSSNLNKVRDGYNFPKEQCHSGNLKILSPQLYLSSKAKGREKNKQG